MGMDRVEGRSRLGLVKETEDQAASWGSVQRKVNDEFAKAKE